MARASTKAQVLSTIGVLDFNITSGGQYDHDDALRLVNSAKRLLAEVINTGDCGKFQGMSGLCQKAPNAVNQVKATEAVTAEMVTASAKIKFKADTKKAAEEKTTAPTAQEFATRSDAQAEADRLNDINQAVIGAKEGAAEALKKKVGTDVLESVLRTADGTGIRGIDDYTIADIIAAIMDGADRPTTNEIHDRMSDIISFTCDWRKKTTTNLEALRLMCSKLASYGIVISEAQITLIMLNNVESAIPHEYGREFWTAMQAIRQLFPYDHVHDATSLKAIMKELSSADGLRVLKEAPSPNELSTGTANAVEASFTRMQRLIKEGYDSSDYSDYSAAAYETANAASSDSSDSEDELAKAQLARRANRREARAAKEKQDKKAKEKTRGRRKPPPTGSVKKCKHCVKYNQRSHHSVPQEECFFNKKYTGFRPYFVCKKMSIKFKP